MGWALETIERALETEAMMRARQETPVLFMGYRTEQVAMMLRFCEALVGKDLRPLSMNDIGEHLKEATKK